MPQINIQIESVSGEKFWDSKKPTPSQVQISTNVNIHGIDQQEKSISIPFVINIGYKPSIGQINLRGEAKVKGKDKELEDIRRKYKENEKPPNFLLQSIVNHSLVEATMISRTLRIPPPIPLPNPEQTEKSDNGSKKLNYVG